MPRLNLRVVTPEQNHARDIARKRVKAYRHPKQPICNIHGPEEGRAPVLNVDETIRRSQPDLIGKK